ncbi:hypothetical protein, partial [Mycobacterium sp.]|uniref:hypothetical protein n=1 Tax=Mycobacterium sp. TaxID=1785 RepID=UPI003C77C651
MARFHAHLPRAHPLCRGDDEQPDRPAADDGHPPVRADSTEAARMPRDGRGFYQARVGDVEA